MQKYYGRYDPQMVDTAEFLRSHRRFVVLILYADPTEQYQKQGYELTPIPMPPMPEGERFFLVEKRM